MPETPLRLTPVHLDESIAYLASCADPAGLARFVEALPGDLDHDLHKSVRGTATSCHVWAAHTSLSAEDLHDLALEAANRSACDVVFIAEPVVPAIRCACGEGCAVADETCAWCLGSTPTTVIDGDAVCEACAAAHREGVGTADTLPPAAPDEHDIDAALAGALPGPVDDDAPSFLPAMRAGLR